jgi:hypothetical protein
MALARPGAGPVFFFEAPATNKIRIEGGCVRKLREARPFTRTWELRDAYSPNPDLLADVNVGAVGLQPIQRLYDIRAGTVREPNHMFHARASLPRRNAHRRTRTR